MNFEEKTLSSKTVFGGHLLRVDVEQVETPMGTKASREIVKHPSAVGLIVVDDQGRLAIVKQWRAPLHDTILEIPAGKVDSRDHGDPMHAAKRELNEERRLQAQELKKVCRCYSSPGFTDEYLTMFLATGVKPVEHKLPQDADEKLALQWISVKEGVKMIADEEITDAKTILAIYYLRGLRNE